MVNLKNSSITEVINDFIEKHQIVTVLFSILIAGFTLSVDLNGAKGPNTMGYDVFKFFITDAGIVHPRKAPDGGVCELRFKGNPYNGYKCAEWIQKFQNVDYLHYEKLNWTSGEHY